MKKLFNFLMVIVILSVYFIPFTYIHVEALSISSFTFDTSRNACRVDGDNQLSFEVAAARNDGEYYNVSCHASYAEAETAMEAYSSTAIDVAVVIETKLVGANAVSTIVNAAYGVVDLATKGSASYNTTLTTDEENGFNNYINGYYGNDAALLDADVTIINTEVGDYFTVNATAVNIRTNYNTNAEVIGTVTNGETRQYYETYEGPTYTWYKIGEDMWVANQGTWLSEYSGTNYETSSKIKIKISGYEGWVNQYESGKLSYEIIPISQVDLETYYGKNDDDELFHKFRYYVTSSGYLEIGPGLSFMEVGTKYYSFDSNYFYTDYTLMIDDYKNGVFDNSVNASNAYFNYYMYLPNRNQSGYTADDINLLIENRGYTEKPDADTTYVNSSGSFTTTLPSNMSVLVGEGASFIASQNLYGVNAFQTFSLAINESGWGRSSIAVAKNNIFGHGAYDSNPFVGATTYDTIADSIAEHASTYVTNYSDPTSSLYYGGHYGNKSSGMNIRYASDPYWGEKQAANYYNNDNTYGLNEYESSILGIKTISSSVRIRKEPTTDSSYIYELNNKTYDVANIPVNVIDVIHGEDVYNDGNDVWYKIQTDPSLDENQNMDSSSLYNWDYSVGYIHSSLVYVEKAVISASDLRVIRSSSPNYLEGVVAYDSNDGIISNSVIVDSSNVNVNVEGTYPLFYNVVNSNGKSTTKVVGVVVYGNSIPSISASDSSVLANTEFDPLLNVSAIDEEDGDITSSIIVNDSGFDNTTPGPYTIGYSVTDVDGNTTDKVVTVTVLSNEVPIIIKDDFTVIQAGSYDFYENMTASDTEDGDLTSSVVAESATFDIHTPGTYPIEYTVTDSNGNTTTHSVTVTVESNGLPVITATNKSTPKNIEIDLLENVIADDYEDGDVTSLVTIFESNVDFTTEGTYEVTYQVIDSDSNEGYRVISVIITSNNNPSISANDIHITINEELTLSNYYSASDIEDGDITEDIIVSGTYDNTTAGTYPITYTVIDADGNEVTKTINLIVEESYTEQEGDFYFDSFTFNEDTDAFNFTGYLTIYGIDNTLEANINYDLILDDNNSDKIYVYDLESMTSNYPFDIISYDGYDFSDAWFTGEVDFSSAPQGDYTIYIRARSSEYETLRVVSNTFLNDMTKRATSDTGRGYQLRTDYYIKSLPLELFIRDEGIISTSSNPTETNMFNFYETIGFDDGRLNIYGGSYSVGVNLSASTDIDRYIILENQESFERLTSSNIGAVDNGPAAITLRYSDGFSKTRAWFNGGIDITSLEVGTYTIYINTQTSDSNDYGELNDIFLRNIVQSYEFDGKTATLAVNQDERFRIELRIE